MLYEYLLHGPVIAHFAEAALTSRSVTCMFIPQHDDSSSSRRILAFVWHVLTACFDTPFLSQIDSWHLKKHRSHPLFVVEACVIKRIKSRKSQG